MTETNMRNLALAFMLLCWTAIFATMSGCERHADLRCTETCRYTPNGSRVCETVCHGGSYA